MRPSDRVELAELGIHALPCDVHVGEAERNLGDHAGIDEALPLGALLLDAQERLVHVGDVHAGPHVLAREAAQAPAVARPLSDGASRRGPCAWMSSPSGRSNTVGLNRSSESRMPCRSLRYAPELARSVWNGRMRVCAMSS